LHIFYYGTSWRYDLDLILSESKDTQENIESYLNELLYCGYLHINEYDTHVKTRTPPPPGFIYIITDGQSYKIGITNNVNSRIKGIQTSHSKKLEVVISQKVLNNTRLEGFLHNKYKDNRLSGEWFNLEPDDIEEIRRIVIQEAVL